MTTHIDRENNTSHALAPAYFGPVAWYCRLATDQLAYINMATPYRKQGTMNRCTIMTANGQQTLTVPVAKPTHPTTLISNHGKWRQEHWNALCTAYGDSPFFIYYEDDLRPFFEEQRWTTLFDFDSDITRKMCELLDINPPQQRYDDTAIPLDNDTGEQSFTPYYQVFQQRHGFQPNLSILDLLFNMGPEATGILLNEK